MVGSAGGVARCSTRTLGAMNSRRRDVVLWLGALAAVPIAFGIYVFASYQMALRQGAVPIQVEPAWYCFAAFSVSLIVGIVLVYFTSLKPTWLRIVVGLVYVAAMAMGLFVVYVFVACASGDCL